MNNIYVVNNCLGISCVHKDGAFDDFLASDPYIYMSQLPFFRQTAPATQLFLGYQGDVRKKANEIFTLKSGNIVVSYIKLCNLTNTAI